MLYRFENLRSKACLASSFAKSFSYLQCRKMQELMASPFLPLVSHSVKLLGKIRHGREIYRARYPTSLMQHVQIHTSEPGRWFHENLAELCLFMEGD